MLKWIVGVLVIVTATAGIFAYIKFSNKIIRLTPETIRTLNQTVAAENESAIVKPAIHKNKVQPSNPLNNVYFGDLHVHTAWSFDAYLSGNRIEPDDAYRFARGNALTLMSGEKVQLTSPLDFAAVTDHAESFGLFEGCADVGITKKQRAFCKKFDEPSVAFFWELRSEATSRPPRRNSFCGEGGAFCLKHGKTTWKRTQEAAERAYQPGEFTTFYAYEYSPPWPKGGSTHRNVIYRNKTVPESAISSYEAATARDLWRQLEETCTGDCEFLTIPHNLNRYYGKAFSKFDEDGGAYTKEDWQRRKAYEPLVEIFQSKGNSECALGVGTSDEACTFEQFFARCEEGETVGCAGKGSFARDGLKMGLSLKKELGFNPLKIGFIGSTDAHNSNPGDTEEWDYRGKASFKDASALMRLKARKLAPNVPMTHNPGGLAAIWANENSRDALFDGLKRKETYATSGTRIKLRFFAGWDYDENIVSASNLVQRAYKQGVPMGGSLSKANNAQNPKLLIWATKDPDSANLDRIQIIKGWVEHGEEKESVTDIACASGISPTNGLCPATVVNVDLENCQLHSDAGDEELAVLWEDKSFNADQDAFYYVRVLQQNTCRWSSYDAIRLGIVPIPEVSPIIQERAWSSPIWYSP